MPQDYFTSPPDQWTFSNSSEQCIPVFIVNDATFDGPVPETFRASFVQDGFDRQETIICIMDDEPGNNFIYACVL